MKNINTETNKLSDTLKSLGLSPSASKIYVYLYKNGKDKIINIANNTNIKRSSVYDYVSELIKTGLINEKEIDGKKYLQAESVSVIIEKLKTKEDEIKENIKYINENKNSLKSFEKDNSPVIRFYEGRDGLCSALDAILFLNEKEIFSVWPYYEMLDNCGTDYLLKFNKKRISKNKFLNVIWVNIKNKNSKKIETENIWEKEGNDILIKRKILGSGEIFDMGYVISGDTVVYLSGTSEIYGYVIKSKANAKLIKQHFDFLQKD